MIMKLSYLQSTQKQSVHNPPVQSVSSAWFQQDSWAAMGDNEHKGDNVHNMLVVLVQC